MFSLGTSNNEKYFGIYLFKQKKKLDFFYFVFLTTFVKHYLEMSIIIEKALLQYVFFKTLHFASLQFLHVLLTAL